MDLRQRTNRFCRRAIAFAVMIRLLCSPLPGKLWNLVRFQSVSLSHTSTETGQSVRFSASLEAFSDYFRESPPPVQPQSIQIPRFSAEDAAGIQMYYGCAQRPELDTLLAAPLEWELTAEEPTVLILHTHTTESYTRQGESYTETADYRTLDEHYNMLSIGDKVAEILAENGIAVIHDRQIHDHPSYNGAYTRARAQTVRLLEENPSVRLVLDLHRDASDSGHAQLKTLAAVDGEASAQLMLVVGTGSGGLTHPGWQENLSLALKLQLQLESLYPGITRPVNLRSSRFNQDVSPGALLVEVGAAGNSHRQALRAAEALARGIVALSRGANFP